MKKAILALALLPLTAQAAHFEIGAGFAHGVRDANGFWYQEGNPYQMRVNSPTGYVGVTGHAWKYLDWHIDYVYLGSYSVDSWDETDQAYGNGCRGSHCAGGYYHFQGAGFMQGVRLTVGPTVAFGHWHLSAQLGPYVYRATWHVTYQDSTWACPRTIRHTPRFQVGSVVGATLRYRRVSLGVAEYFMNVPQDVYPPLIHGSWAMTAAYRF